VSDLEAAKAFYVGALDRSDTGWCTRSRVDSRTSRMRTGSTSGSASEDHSVEPHVAFECGDRATVDSFYAAAITAGGADNGAPGLRPQYDANYYAAYVLDLDGNNIEAVCHHAST